MTDRVSVLTVILDRDYREDDVQEIVNAVNMVKGVLRVGTNIVNHVEHASRERARQELREKLWDVLK